MGRTHKRKWRVKRSNEFDELKEKSDVDHCALTTSNFGRTYKARNERFINETKK